MKDFFHQIAVKVSTAAGGPYTFVAACLIIIGWAVLGPMFNYSNTWQLFINTGTTIVTFLMVFLIQNTQNRDSKAMQLKLDELIRTGLADDSFVDLEDLSDEELEKLDEEFRRIHDSQPKPVASIHKLHKQIVSARSRRQH